MFKFDVDAYHEGTHRITRASIKHEARPEGRNTSTQGVAKALSPPGVSYSKRNGIRRSAKPGVKGRDTSAQGVAKRSPALHGDERTKP